MSVGLRLVIVLHGLIVVREYEAASLDQGHAMVQAVVSQDISIIQDDNATVQTAKQIQEWIPEKSQMLSVASPVTRSKQH